MENEKNVMYVLSYQSGASDIDYGTDNHIYIAGIYTTREKAEEAKKIREDHVETELKIIDDLDQKFEQYEYIIDSTYRLANPMPDNAAERNAWFEKKAADTKKIMAQYISKEEIDQFERLKNAYASYGSRCAMETDIKFSIDEIPVGQRVDIYLGGASYME